MQAWVVVAGWALVAALVLGARWLWRRPRLDVELSLRGTTRGGTLYVRVHNRGRRAARGVRVRTEWVAGGDRALVQEALVEEIEGRGAAALPVRDLHRAIEGRSERWSALRVEARAANALPASRQLVLEARPVAQEPPAEPVRYRSADAPCPGSPDGRHLYRTARFLNDGVMETWHVCERCRHLRRDPLTPAEEQAQARVRRARAERERQKLEEELDRLRHEEEARPPPRSRALEGDTMPVAVAFWVLGLDESAGWEEVVQAHRRLARETHPDRGAADDPAARRQREERMADVNRARDVLREHLGK